MRKVFTLIMLVFCSIYMGGCSDDDETPGFDDSTSPGDSIKWNKIIMEVNTSGKQTVRLNVYGGGETEANLKIDWGDGNKSEDKFTINEEHVYSEEKNYTITVTGNDISGFNCPNLNIVSIDLTECQGLVTLNCTNSSLTGLDVNKNTRLANLSCGNNQLVSLNISNNEELEYLDCSYNEITSLDTRHNPQISYLICNNNKIATLDVSNNPRLTNLVCYYNNITSLDFTNNTQIRQIYCAFNDLTKEATDFMYESLPHVHDYAVIWPDSYTSEQSQKASEKGWGVNRWP